MPGCFLGRIAQGVVRRLRKVRRDEHMSEGHAYPLSVIAASSVPDRDFPQIRELRVGRNGRAWANIPSGAGAPRPIPPMHERAANPDGGPASALRAAAAGPPVHRAWVLAALHA